MSMITGSEVTVQNVVKVTQVLLQCMGCCLMQNNLKCIGYYHRTILHYKNFVAKTICTLYIWFQR